MCGGSKNWSNYDTKDYRSLVSKWFDQSTNNEANLEIKVHTAGQTRLSTSKTLICTTTQGSTLSLYISPLEVFTPGIKNFETNLTT